MREEIHDDERDPGHTLEACMRKFSEVTLAPRIWRDRDPGDEDPAAKNIEVFRVTPGPRIDVDPPRSRR